MRHRRHRHHSAFHVKVMDLFHATWLSSAIVSQVPGCICLHLVVPNVFSCHGTSTRLRHATRFSEPGLRHDFGAQDTVLQRYNWRCRCVGFFRGFRLWSSHNENPNIMCMYHYIYNYIYIYDYICMIIYIYIYDYIYIIIYIPIDELMTIPQYGKTIQLLTTAHLIHMI